MWPSKLILHFKKPLQLGSALCDVLHDSLLSVDAVHCSAGEAVYALRVPEFMCTQLVEILPLQLGKPI